MGESVDGHLEAGLDVFETFKIIAGALDAGHGVEHGGSGVVPGDEQGAAGAVFVPGSVGQAGEGERKGDGQDIEAEESGPDPGVGAAESPGEKKKDGHQQGGNHQSPDGQSGGMCDPEEGIMEGFVLDPGVRKERKGPVVIEFRGPSPSIDEIEEGPGRPWAQGPREKHQEWGWGAADGFEEKKADEFKAETESRQPRGNRWKQGCGFVHAIDVKRQDLDGQDYSGGGSATIDGGAMGS